MCNCNSLQLTRFYVVDVSILTARGVTEPLQDPYLEVGIRGNEESLVKKHASLVHEDHPGCDFYFKCSFEMMLPGSCELIFRLFTTGVFGATLVGEASMDVEDRHVAQLNKKLRQASNVQWLRQNISPEADIEAGCEGKVQAMRCFPLPVS